MFNNEYILIALERRHDESVPSVRKPNIRESAASDPCLLPRLPSTRFIDREAGASGPKAILRQLRRSPSPPSPSSEVLETTTNLSDTDSTSPRASIDSGTSLSRTGSTLKGWFSSRQKPAVSTGWKEPQLYEVFRAIERKDIMFLMEVRDRAFHLLLKKSGIGDATPLVHSMRLGDSHKDVTILLLGAMSRWVNHLEDNDMADKRTKPLLKALRTNLKLAIDCGLQRSQSELIASFMQTLVMSEGDKWVLSESQEISLSLRAGTDGRPVQTAEAAVRKFTTRQLRKADLIAALEDYICNATVDLLVMGVWTCVMTTVQAEPIPTYYFARDDRVYKAFLDRLQKHRIEISALSKRLKWQIRVLEKGLEGRTTTYRYKVDLLAGELDEGDGV